MSTLFDPKDSNTFLGLGSSAISFKATTDWTFDEEIGILVCAKCQIPIKINESDIRSWIGKCKGCERKRQKKQALFLVLGIFLSFLFSKWLGLM